MLCVYVSTRGEIFSLKFTKYRLAVRLRPDPLGELQRSPRPLAAIRGATFKGMGGEGKAGGREGSPRRGGGSGRRGGNLLQGVRGDRRPCYLAPTSQVVIKNIYENSRVSSSYVAVYLTYHECLAQAQSSRLVVPCTRHIAKTYNAGYRNATILAPTSVANTTCQ